MSAIVIRRCTLRVTRRGGWCWGEDRRALAERITGLVPMLVAKRLAELFGDAPDEQEVAAPLRLDVRLTSACVRDPLALADAVRRALSIWQPPAVAESVATTPAAYDDDSKSAPWNIAPDDARAGGPAASFGSPILSLLLEWRDAGSLTSNLAALPEEVAAVWFLRLVERAPVAIRPAAPGGEDFALAVEALVARLAVALAGPEARARARLFVAVELLAVYGALPPPGVLVAALEARAAPQSSRPRRGDPGSVTARSDDPALRKGPPTQSDQAHVQLARPGPPPAAPRQSAPREIALDSVLPFLVLGMLHRIGWLRVAAAAFEGAGDEARGACLAAAMAERLVAPRRIGHDGRHRTIAFFAGLESAPSAKALADWGERHHAHLAPIADFTARTIAHGHDPLQPIVLLGTGHGPAARFVLVDCDGGYPVGVADGPIDCARILARFRASPLLIMREAATPTLLAALLAQNHTWITDAPPGRGELAERLPGRDALWATGDMPPARLRAAASRFSEMDAQARDCSTRLLRDILPLDRIAFLGTGMGLGLLSWSLWHAREPVHPLLALDRLSDLDGVARIDADAIEIRPAIGRRYLDLRDAGALTPIPEVPWLGGRSVRFAGP